MASLRLLRRGSVAVAGGGAYVLGVYLSYVYWKFSSDEDATASPLGGSGGKTGCSCSCSHVHDPNRNAQYGRIAANYDESIGRDEMMLGINLLRRSLLYFHANGTVLEVASGTGRNLDFYPSSTVQRVLLTDASEEMLSQAKTKLQDRAFQRPQFAVMRADATSIDFLPDSSVDTVVDTFGLCSFDNPFSVLEEMVRVCKPGGKILLLEHGRSHTSEWVNRHLDKNAEQHAANWGCVWNRDLDKLLLGDKAQEKLEVEVLHKWHFGTTYYVVCRPKK